MPRTYSARGRRSLRSLVSLVLLVCCLSSLTISQAATASRYGKLPADALPGDLAFEGYFKQETARLARTADARLAEVTASTWPAYQEQGRRELLEMLGLNPLPPKTDLKATITGTLEHPEFTVEKLHFQSRPGLYVTANLYLPKGLTAPAPAILYVCGHSRVVTNGVSYGSKVAYQHHAVWFARHGYVCLLIDSVELGEILGQHHGTYRENRWWWNSRGYSAAAAEAWNCVRALDYLETRPEVDAKRLGVTGRSGGGAYSWWIAALDDRIQAACPVAGITDLHNHVVDGVVEGHCDCMFMVNTYRWDYAQVAALVAPRPLLICNSDKDTIFPLDGVVRLHSQVRGVYEALGAGDRLGLLITEGPHSDTQDLQVPVFRWFNRWLKNDSSPIEKAAVRLFSGQQLKVFQTLPEDEITSSCDEHFTRLASDDDPFDAVDVRSNLLARTFGGWPATPGPLALKPVASASTNGLQFRQFEYQSEPGMALNLFVIASEGNAPRSVRLQILDQSSWDALSPLLDSWGKVSSESATSQVQLSTLSKLVEDRQALVLVVPRGVGPSAFTEKAPYSNHLRRRFMLLGQTLAGMQVWDVRRAIASVRQLPEYANAALHVNAVPEMTEIAAFATAFEPELASLTLAHPPREDHAAPDFLNSSRILTPSQLLRLARSSCPVSITAPEPTRAPRE